MSTISMTMNLILFFLFFEYIDISFMMTFNMTMAESTFVFNFNEMIFSLVVLMISLIVMFFSFFYMKDDYSKNRFFLLTFFFIFSMMFLIYSKSLIILIIGWEGLGIFSFLLIVYYLKNDSLMSGILTLVMNRVGDIFLIASLSIWMMNMSLLHLNCSLMNYSLNSMEITLMTFMIITMISKSPQYPMNSWLLAAMSAPTPISSLVHSSTLVTAGCFFFLKLMMFYLNFEFKMIFINLMLITILFASLAGIVLMDLKKIIALSTLSQISLIFMMFFLNMNISGLIHLLFHALFKSSLFILAGVMMMKSNSSQDNRYQHFFLNFTLLELLWIYINFSLTAMFFSLSFFSKEMIMHSFLILDLWFKVLFYFICLLTLVYSWKLFYSVNIFKVIKLNLNLNWKMMFLVLILIMISLSSFLVIFFYLSVNESFKLTLNFKYLEILTYFSLLFYMFKINLYKNMIYFFFFLKKLFYSMEISINSFSLINFFFVVKKNNDKLWTDLSKMMVFFINHNSIFFLKIFKEVEFLFFSLFLLFFFFLL